MEVHHSLVLLAVSVSFCHVVMYMVVDKGVLRIFVPPIIALITYSNQ